jgi:V8-like Glu-specific endopeptidase
MISRRLAPVIGTLLCLIVTAAFGDEGMWTFQNFPADRVQEKYGAKIDDAWLSRVQRSITRLEGGCTGSFVSPDGLVLTNHHCSMQCLSELSSEKEDLIGKGFNSGSRAKERQCPGGMISVLMDVEDITAKVNAATSGLDSTKANEARKQTLSKLEAACAATGKNDTKNGPLACESVTLYQGGQYFLYKYKRYDDVRLVLAPEYPIAAFGGDPDNFNFPRWSLDFTLMRAYENGKPARTPNHLSWRTEGPKAGEAVFVPGHPGSTNRLMTVEQLKLQRDTQFPAYLYRNSELRGRLIQWGKTGDEPTRIIQRPLQSIENSLKVYRGLQRALLDDRLMSQKESAEQGLREFVLEKPQLTSQVGSAWDDIAAAQDRYRQIFDRYQYLELGAGFNSRLFAYARQLVRSAAERSKPNELRLREYADSVLPKLEASMLATTPIYPDYEQLTFSFSLDKMREQLGPDDAIVRSLMIKDSPDTLAKRLVTETKLADASVRKALWDGGQAAIDASTDAMIVLARDIDAEARVLRKTYEDEIQAPVAAAQERIAGARFAAFGTQTYPDATFTLRISYGAVQGWTEKGQDIAPFTYLDRIYERATGEAPFALPATWLEAKDKLDPRTPFNFVATVDIVGGNSGSPVIDAQGNLVGLAFDGNIHSLSGNYWYDAEQNRAVAVHPAIILTALRDVYGAKDLVKEITKR